MVNEEAIVLKTFRYQEKGMIVKAMVKNNGLKTFIVKNINTKNAKIKPAFFIPFTKLIIAFKNTEQNKLLHFSNAEIANAADEIRNHPYKNLQAIFLNEVFYKCMVSDSLDNALYKSMDEIIETLKIHEFNPDFHLFATLLWCNALGIFPNENSMATGKYFCFADGKFTKQKPEHVFYEEEQTSQMWKDLIFNSKPYYNTKFFSREERKILLSSIIKYMKFHLPGLADFKSHEVLMDLG